MPQRRKSSPIVKTSLQLPEDLWRRAKFYAAEHRIDLRDVIMQALQSFLPEPKGGRDAK
jgi:hypothetical protein